MEEIIMTGYHISFFRHGLTDANEKGIYIGRTDYPLSERGRSELASKLDTYEYPVPDRIYSSPLIRCTETAELLFPDSTVIAVPELQELDFGDFEGKTVDELIQREDFKEYLRGGAAACPPNGESVEQLSARSYRAMQKIIEEMMRDDIHCAAVVTHAAIITNLLAGFGLPKVPPNEIICEPGEGFEILVTAHLWQRSDAFEILGMVPYEKPETT